MVFHSYVKWISRFLLAPKLSGLNHRQPKHEIRGINDTYANANVTLALEGCYVTKIRFTKVCMGNLRV